MQKIFYTFKIEDLNSFEDGKKTFKNLFIRLSPDIEKSLFSEKVFYISGNNNNVGNLIYETLFIGEINITKIDSVPENFQSTGVVIFPLPERNDIYDVIHFFINNINIAISKEVITDIDNSHHSILIKSGISCFACHRETPDNLNFCIHCGNEFIKKESLKTYSVKITNLESTNSKLKLAKYLSDITSNDYKTMLEYLTRLPTVFNFSMYPSELEQFLKILDDYKAVYRVINTETFSFEKFFSTFIPYGNINIGTIHADKNYLDPVISKLAVESLRTSSSDVLQKVVTRCLFEVYRITELSRNTENTSKLLFEEIEKDVNELLGKFLYFIRRADKLNIYFSEHSPQKINNDIEVLKNKITKSDNQISIEMYKEALDLKEKEYNDLIALNNTIDVLQSQITSVMTILGSMRTKITYLSTFDIQKNKGEFSELTNLKSNLISKIKAIEETLSI